jgi:hypothetical protein
VRILNGNSRGFKSYWFERGKHRFLKVSNKEASGVIALNPKSQFMSSLHIPFLELEGEGLMRVGILDAK